MQREQALAGGKDLGPCVAPFVLPTVQRFRHTIDTETCGTPRIIPCRSASFLEGPSSVFPYGSVVTPISFAPRCEGYLVELRLH